MSNKLILTVGLPRSGKSTWAVAQGVPVVSPDAIRLAIHGQPFIPQAEVLVWGIAKVMVRALFLAGHSTVIVDATNGTVERRATWKSSSWVRTYEVFDTPQDECVKRAHATSQEYLVPVIEEMVAKWEPLSAEDYDDQ